jgi:hypothetical protein
MLLGILSLITLTSSLLTLIPTALQDVKYSTIFVVGSQVVKVIISSLAAVVYRSVEALLVAAVITQVLSTVALFWYLYKRFGHFWGHFDWDFFREQLAYAIPIGIYGSLWVVQKYMDNYFVGHYFGPSDFAIYSVGWVDFALFSLVLESIAAVMVVRVSALQHQDRKAEIRRLSAAAVNRLAALQFPTCALLLVAGHDLIVLVYTKAYERSAPIFCVAILLLALTASVHLADANRNLGVSLFRVNTGHSTFRNAGSCSGRRRCSVCRAHCDGLEGRPGRRDDCQRFVPVQGPGKGHGVNRRRRPRGLCCSQPHQPSFAGSAHRSGKRVGCGDLSPRDVPVPLAGMGSAFKGADIRLDTDGIGKNTQCERLKPVRKGWPNFKSERGPVLVSGLQIAAKLDIISWTPIFGD